MIQLGNSSKIQEDSFNSCVKSNSGYRLNITGAETHSRGSDNHSNRLNNKTGSPNQSSNWRQNPNFFQSSPVLLRRNQSKIMASGTEHGGMKSFRAAKMKTNLKMAAGGICRPFIKNNSSFKYEW